MLALVSIQAGLSGCGPCDLDAPLFADRIDPRAGFAALRADAIVERARTSLPPRLDQWRVELLGRLDGESYERTIASRKPPCIGDAWSAAALWDYTSEPNSVVPRLDAGACYRVSTDADALATQLGAYTFEGSPLSGVMPGEARRRLERALQFVTDATSPWERDRNVEPARAGFIAEAGGCLTGSDSRFHVASAVCRQHYHKLILIEGRSVVSVDTLSDCNQDITTLRERSLRVLVAIAGH